LKDFKKNLLVQKKIQINGMFKRCFSIHMLVSSLRLSSLVTDASPFSHLQTSSDSQYANIGRSRIGKGDVPLMLQEVAQHSGNGCLMDPPAVP